jgi:DNA-binding NarL/FixJ family response regulator
VVSQPNVPFAKTKIVRESPHIFAALRAGAKGYLLKTAGPDELTQAIRIVHGGHSALDPDVTARVMDRLSDPAAQQSDKLSERELDVLRLAGRGLTNRAIGHELNISDRTVHSHDDELFGPCQVRPFGACGLHVDRIQSWQDAGPASARRT